MNLIPLLEKEKDVKYKEFSEKIVSDTKYPILGVRVPIIRKLAKTLIKSGVKDARLLPENGFTYYEECLLYGFIIAGDKSLSFNEKTALLDKYLTFSDSWGITDSVAAAFKDVNKNREKATEFIYSLITREQPYAVRFGIVLLTLYYTGEHFKKEHAANVLSIKTGDYYVDMAIAWYVSVLLAKNREYALQIIKNRLLPPFIHNKAIQKAVESYRVNTEDKIYLKKLKIKSRVISDLNKEKTNE